MNKLDYKSSSLIRKSYEILPFQGIWTWLTGKEIHGRKQLWNSNSSEAIFWATLWTVGGSILSYYAFLNFQDHSLISFFIYIIGIIFSTSGARYIVATLIHHSVHGHLFTRKTYLNRIFCEFFSTVLLIQPYDSYKKFHVYEHHGKDFSTFMDKDLSAIYQLGFKPGKTKKQLYINLFLTLFNPKIHISYLTGRVKSNLINLPKYRLFMSIIWLSILGYVCFRNGLEFSILLVLIPYVILYQICSILHLVTEHVWLLRNLNEPVKISHYNNCLSRFCGETCPRDFSIKNWLLWAKWIFNHLFFHLPTRMLIVQGSLVCHDWHHRFGGEKRWYLYSQLRENNAKKLHDENVFDYIEVWGFHNAVDYVFEKMSDAQPVTQKNNQQYRLN